MCTFSFIVGGCGTDVAATTIALSATTSQCYCYCYYWLCPKTKVRQTAAATQWLWQIFEGRYVRGGDGGGSNHDNKNTGSALNCYYRQAIHTRWCCWSAYVCCVRIERRSRCRCCNDALRRAALVITTIAMVGLSCCSQQRTTHHHHHHQQWKCRNNKSNN